MAIHEADCPEEQVLADRRSFDLDEDAWAAFTEMLERPTVYKPRLAALLAEVSDQADADRPGALAAGGLAAAGQHGGEDKG